MRSHALLLTLLAGCGLAGCGVANRSYSTTWLGARGQMPEAECVQNAVGAMDQVWKVEARDNGLGVFLKWPGHSVDELVALDARTDTQMKKAGYKGYTHFPEINIRFVPSPDGPHFQMWYMGWLKPDDYREMAAKRIVGQVASACHVPALDHATERRDSTACPYLFNI